MLVRILKPFLVMLLLAGQAYANTEVLPDALVKSVTDDVLSTLRADKDLQNGNTRKAAELVETKVLPHFNFNRMTASAVGKDWRMATPEQRLKLVAEFKTLLVRTYANALSSYKNQTVEFRPFKMAPTDTEVMVKTQIIQPGGKPIPLDYALEKAESGWMVYDVVVAGVSLVITYRETFAQQIRSGGLDGLIEALQTKNRGGAAVPATSTASAAK